VDADPIGTLSDFSASINWGDGTTSAGTVSQPGGAGTAFAVAGTHTYTTAGTDTVVVTVSDIGGQTAAVSFAATVGTSIFVLDPAASGALTVTGGATLSVTGDVVVDSNSPSALTASGTSLISAAQILVTGGVSASNGAVLSPAPTTGVARLPDPLAGLPVPPSSLPVQGSVNAKSSVTIQPGIYTQILASGKGTVLTLSPGIYVIQGGGLSISNSASISGNGVLIYNAGSNFPSAGGTFGAVSLNGSGTFSLAAATTGTYAGILLFQASDNTQAVSLTANATVGLSGTLYAPAAQLVINGSGQLTTAAIVGQLRFTGNGGTQTASTLAPAASSIQALPAAPSGSSAQSVGVSTVGAGPGSLAGPAAQYSAQSTTGARGAGSAASDSAAGSIHPAKAQSQSLQALDTIFADLTASGDLVLA